jgi:hypothetical protein
MTAGGRHIFRGLARAEYAGLLTLAEAYRSYFSLSLSCAQTLASIILDGARRARRDDASPWVTAGDDVYRACSEHLARAAAIPRLSCFAFVDRLDRLREQSRRAADAVPRQPGMGAGPGA